MLLAIAKHNKDIFLVAGGPHTDSMCSSASVPYHHGGQPVFEEFLNNLTDSLMSVHLHIVGTRSEQEEDLRSSEQMYQAPAICLSISAYPLFPRIFQT